MDYRVYVEQTTHTWTEIEADSPEEVLEIVESGDYPTKDVHVDDQIVRVYHEGNIPLLEEGGPQSPTKQQEEGLASVQAYNVPADWFTKIDERLDLNVVAIGENFVWSFTISPNGDVSSCEAHLGEFSTGIEV